tara:strand:- start:178 stop:1488 length:1311 start_codon:yes stop_codon:yes gene_type:complete
MTRQKAEIARNKSKAIRKLYNNGEISKSEAVKRHKEAGLEVPSSLKEENNDLYGDINDIVYEELKFALDEKRKKKKKKKKKKAKRDACYHKVKARYDVWPSAYASGALVKCRKVGAANWGNSKKEHLQAIVEDELTKVLQEKETIEEAYLPFIGGKMSKDELQGAKTQAISALQSLQQMIDAGENVNDTQAAKDSLEDSIKRLEYYVNNRTSKDAADKAYERYKKALKNANDVRKQVHDDYKTKSASPPKPAATKKSNMPLSAEQEAILRDKESRAFDIWKKSSGLGGGQNATQVFMRAKAAFLRKGGSPLEWPEYAVDIDAPSRKRGAGRIAESKQENSIEDLVYYTLFEVLNEKKNLDEDLRKWFGRKGAPGKKKGWVDCNTCRKDKKTGRKKCSACGRSSGEKRSKYPSCRPTPSACGKRGNWGKKSKKGKKG